MGSRFLDGICFVAGSLDDEAYYTVTWSSFLISGIVLSLNKFGVVPDRFHRACAAIAAFQVVVLSLALSRKLENLNR